MPGHGIPIGREDLRWHIDYLATVQKQVQVAIDQKIALEQTVAQMQMPEYRGDVLFDWVHPSLNVPAASRTCWRSNNASTRIWKRSGRDLSDRADHS